MDSQKESDAQAQNAATFNYFQKGQDWVHGANQLEQSPIDIETEAAVPAHEKLKFELFLADQDFHGLTVLDTYNSLQVVGPFSKLYGTDVDGQVLEFEAVQFHFHAPSEHTINQGFYDLEMHIVHQITADCFARTNTSRNLAVVGIFFQVDESPDAVPHPFVDALKLHEVGDEFSMNFNNVWKDDLKDELLYYAYKGSLTVPPCSANANWYVLEKPVKITRQQQLHFDLRWKDNPHYAGGHGNNRPVQPLAGRRVLKSTNCCIKGSTHEHERTLYVERPPVLDGVDIVTIPAEEDHVVLNHNPEETPSRIRESVRGQSFYSRISSIDSRAGSLYHKDNSPMLARGESFDRNTVRTSVFGKEVPAELLLLGNLYEETVENVRQSVHHSDVPIEVLRLRESMASKDSSQRGSLHSKEKLHKTDSFHSRDSPPMKQKSTHLNEIPLDLLKFGSCFPTENANQSNRGSQYSKDHHGSHYSKEAPADLIKGEEEDVRRPGQTIYSKTVPAEISNLLKDVHSLDDDDEDEQK